MQIDTLSKILYSKSLNDAQKVSLLKEFVKEPINAQPSGIVHREGDYPFERANARGVEYTGGLSDIINKVRLASHNFEPVTKRSM